MDFKNSLNGTIDFVAGKFYCRFNDKDGNNTPTVETTTAGVCKLIDELNVMPGKKSFTGIFEDPDREREMKVLRFCGPIGWTMIDGKMLISDGEDGEKCLYSFDSNLRSLLFSVVAEADKK